MNSLFPFVKPITFRPLDYLTRHTGLINVDTANLYYKNSKSPQPFRASDMVGFGFSYCFNY